MKTFIFVEQNGSGTLTLSAPNLEEAERELDEKVKHSSNWRVEDEEGEEE